MLVRSSVAAALLRPRWKAHPCLFAHAPVGGMAALGLAARRAVTGLRSALPGVLGCPVSVRCVVGVLSWAYMYMSFISVARAASLVCVFFVPQAYVKPEACRLALCSCAL